jgi:hypothetical protein
LDCQIGSMVGSRYCLRYYGSIPAIRLLVVSFNRFDHRFGIPVLAQPGLSFNKAVQAPS